MLAQKVPPRAGTFSTEILLDARDVVRYCWQIVVISCVPFCKTRHWRTRQKGNTPQMGASLTDNPQYNPTKPLPLALLPNGISNIQNEVHHDRAGSCHMARERVGDHPLSGQAHPLLLHGEGSSGPQEANGRRVRGSAPSAPAAPQRGEYPDHAAFARVGFSDAERAAFAARVPAEDHPHEIQWKHIAIAIAVLAGAGAEFCWRKRSVLARAFGRILVGALAVAGVWLCLCFVMIGGAR